jgi:hypothetical protein
MATAKPIKKGKKLGAVKPLLKVSVQKKIMPLTRMG